MAHTLKIIILSFLLLYLVMLILISTKRRMCCSIYLCAYVVCVYVPSRYLKGTYYYDYYIPRLCLALAAFTAWSSQLKNITPNYLKDVEQMFDKL